MATKNIVPRTGSQGQLGTDTKPWKRVVAITGSFDYVSGSVFVVGDVTASKFKGDGSGLTNVNAGGIEFADINNKNVAISGSWGGALSGSLNLISGSGTSTASFGRIEVASITASGVIRADGFQSKTGGTAIEFSDAISSTGDVTATGGTLGNVRVGVTGDNEIDTSTGNLTIDSTGGTTTIDDDLSVSGKTSFTGNVTASGDISSSATGSFGRVEAIKYSGDGSGLTNVSAGSIAYSNITGAPSQSLSLRATQVTASIASATSSIDVLVNREIASGTGLSGGGDLSSDRTLAIDFSDTTFATGISGSLGTNATLIRTLTAAGISGSLGTNAALIRTLTAAGISGSLGTNATLIRTLTAAGISGSLGTNSSLIRTLTALGISGSTVLAEGSSQGQITHNSVAVNVNALGTDDTPTFAGLTSTGNVIIQGDLTAKNYIVSSSVTHMTRSFSSGSTIFGDDSNDTHQFTGSLIITGSISSSANTTASFGELIIGSTDKQLYSHFSQSIQSRVASAVAGGVTSVAGGTGISSTGGTTPTLAIDFTDSALKSGISGSLGSNASLIRTLTALGISGSLGSNATLIRTLTAAGISGSLGTNATLIRTLTAAGISGSFTPASSSFSTRVTLEESNVDALQARNIDTGLGLSGGGDLSSDRTLTIDFSDTTFATGISGSLGSNAAVIRSLNRAGISGSLGSNASLIRTLTALGISGSLGSNATLIRTLTAAGISGSLGSNATLIRTLTAAGISGSLGSNAALIRTLTAAGITGSTVLAEGSSQGQITHNSVAVNVNALGTNDSPTFAGLKSTSGLTSTGSLLISGSITQQGGVDTTFTASFGRIEAQHISASKLFVDSDSIVIGGVTIGETVASNIQALDQAVNTTSDVQFGSIELGNASDTTIARSDAGVVTIEGAVVRTGTVAVNVGGTGATDASNARTNLGLGSSNNVTFAQVTASAARINGNITGSGTSTGSFGRINATKFYGDGSNLTGVSTTPFPFTGSAGIKGNLSVTSHITSSGNISGSGTSTASFGHVHITDGTAGLGIGDSNDLVLYHNGNHSYIKDSGTGNLYIQGGTQTFQNAAATKTMMVLNAANSVDLHYNNDKKFETTRTGINVTGAVTASTIDIDSIQGNWTNAGNTVADLGTITTVDINGGTINGITDLAIADGGTGASTAAAARLNLNDGSGIISGSSIASSAQGQVALTTNDVAASAVDLGLQTGDSPTFASLTLSGNLTVNGTTTTVNSTTVDIGDRIIELNAASAAGFGGIHVRDTVGTTQTGSLVWDTTNNYWLGGLTGSEVKLSTISATETLTNKTLTSPDINTPDIDGGTIDGTLIGGSSANRGVFTQVTASGNISSSATGSFGRLEVSVLSGNSPLVIDADQTKFSAPVTMSSGFRIDSLTANRVPFATTNGRIVDDSDFTFSTDTLTVTKLGAFQAVGAIDFNSQAMTNVDINSGTITGITDLAVADGGTGAGTFTDGGVLLGSGTDAITATAVLTNGQLLIGDNNGDPTIGTLTGTSNQVTVTNGAGTITLATPQDIHTSAKPTFAQITGSLFNNGFINSTNNALFVDTTNKTVGIGKKAYGSSTTNGAWFADLAGSNGYAQISVNGTNEALSLNQNSTGPILLGRNSGTIKFRVAVDGNVTASLGGQFGGVVQGTKIQTSNGGGPQLVNSTPNGTTPSIYPSMGDTNTGIGYGGSDGTTADNINLITGGTTGLYIDSSQNVVIPTGNLSVTGNTTLGDASGDTVTINAETIDLANIAAGTDNSVVVYNGSSLVTDEIDSRVWGSTLLDTDGTGTDNELAIFTDSNTVEGNANLTYDGTRLVVVGHVSASEVSSSTYYGDGSNLTGITTTPFPFTGSAGISGSLSLDRQASNSGSTIFDIKGTQGTLFSVVDEMSGSIFTANTIAGISVIEAFSDQRVKLGPVSNRLSIDASGNVDIGGNISGSGTSTGSFGRIETAGGVVIDNGNILGKTDNSTEIGSTPDNGAIKKLYMVQGGEISFGDTTTSNFFGISEGTNNSFGDSDTMGIYYRNGLNVYSANNSQRLKMHANGRLGLNTTSDAGYLLDVNGTSRFSGTLEVHGGNISGSGTSTGSFGHVNVGQYVKLDSAGDVWAGAYNSTSGKAMLTKTGTQVRIGEVEAESSAHPLHIYSAGASIANFDEGAGGTLTLGSTLIKSDDGSYFPNAVGFGATPDNSYTVDIGGTPLLGFKRSGTRVGYIQTTSDNDLDISTHNSGYKLRLNVFNNGEIHTGTGKFVFGGNISGSGTSTGSFGRVSTATLDLDSIKGNWTNAGNTVADLGTITTADINGGTIDGITSLTAGGDLDIGSHDLRAATLTADGLTSGRVVFAGTNGVLSDNSTFVFDGTNLGIGTSSPSSYYNSPLVTYKATSNYLTIATDDGGISSILMADGTTSDQAYRGQLEYKHTGDEWRFHAGNSHLATLNALVGLSITGHITASGNLVANGNIVGDGSTNITGIKTGSIGNVHATNNIGINTTNPEAKLHIKGGSFNSSLYIQGGGDQGIKFAGSDGVVDGYIYALSGAIGFLDDDGNWAIQHTTDTSTQFYVNNSLKMTLLANGNFGIGVSDPDSLLEVAGTSHFQGISTFDSNVIVTGNLTVNGTTTSVNSTAVNIGDRIIELNAASAAGFGGIYVRDASGNQTGSLVWDVGNNYWKGGLTGSEVRMSTISGTETLTNKTLTSPDINAGTVDGITTLTTGTITSAVDLKEGGGNTVFTYGTEDLSSDEALEIKIGDVDSATTGTYLSIKPYSEEADFGAMDVTVAGGIIHKGDTDTKIQFTSDQIQFRAGNVNMLTLAESSTDTATFVADTIDVGSALVSGSATSTGSFGKVLVGSSGLVRSGSTLFEVQGNRGTLFNVTDEMSGSIFSANTVAGLPVIEAFSDQRVILGKSSDPITVKESSNSETFLSGSAQSTASFGRIQASTIGGNSPLTIDASNFSVDANGTISGSGLSTGSFGVIQGKLEGAKVVISVPSIRSSRFRSRSPWNAEAESGYWSAISSSYLRLDGNSGPGSATYLTVSGSVTASAAGSGVTAGKFDFWPNNDTTITRASSGDIAVEGNTVYRAGGTDVPVADGGTGASSFTIKSVIVSDDSSTTSALAAKQMDGSGELLIGGSSGPEVSTLTAGSNVTITNGNGAITIASTDTNTMGSGFTVSADTNTATTTITQGDTLTISGGTNVSTVSNPDGTITITSTDTNTMGTGFTVSATTDTNATTITQGDDLFFAAGAGITCETTADGTVTITNTSLASSVTRGTLGVDTDDDVRFDSLGIGMAATGTTGQIDAAADVIAYSSSDRRWKENLIRIPNPLDKIGKISGYEFDWKELTDEERKTQHSRVGHDVGVVAQEIQEVLPEVVKERDNGYLAVDYEKIVPLLIESIKELKSELDELKKKV